MFGANEESVMGQPPKDDPPLVVGECCRLNSGSPDLLVAEADGDDVVVTWDRDGEPQRHTLLRAMVRRKAVITSWWATRGWTRLAAEWR